MTSKTTSGAEEENISRRIVKRRHSDDTGVTEKWSNKQFKASVTEEKISGRNVKRRHSDETGGTEYLPNKHLKASGEIKLRAVDDFDPKLLRYREKVELNIILKSGKLTNKREKIEHSNDSRTETLTEHLSVSKIKGHEQPQMLDQNERHQDGCGKCEMRNGREVCDLQELGVPIQEKPNNLENEFIASENKDNRTSVETSEIQSQEETIKTEELKTVMLEKELTTDKEDLPKTKEHESSDSEEGDPRALMLTFKRGDKMETIAPTNIGDTDGWWMVRNLNSGEKGIIPRNRVVIEKDQQTSKTTLSEFPFELLDAVLENSLLHWILNSSPQNGDEDIIISLASVDFTWYQRITKQRFKKRMWRRMKDFYRKTKKRPSIILNSRNYLLENILPNDELIASLLSLNCLTEEQRHFIQRQRSNADKNAELLHVLSSFDETKFSNFLKCLRQRNQKTVARIIENGGGVIKVEVQHYGATSIDTQLLHQQMEDFRNRNKPWSYQTDGIISLLKMDGIEIINSQLDRQSVVVWIWCRSQEAVENIQWLYESNQLIDVFFDFANIKPSTYEIVQSKVINIDSSQFKKSVVMCPISVKFDERIDIGKNEVVLGVTKLRNEIYVLCELVSSPASPNVIRVFEDRNPFRLQNRIQLKEIKYPWDIGSSEKENCLYVSDKIEKCIWKITRETDDTHKLSKWLTIDFEPRSLSVSSDGQLLLVGEMSSILTVYGSNAELIRSIQLTPELSNPLHAVKTSIGNFIILHEWPVKKEDEEESGPSETVWKWVLSELTRDGQMVVRRFISSYETQELQDSQHLSLDSDDRVYLADNGNHTVILLDSDLKEEQEGPEEQEEQKKQEEQEVQEEQEEQDEPDEEDKTTTLGPVSLCYDDEKRQILVVEGDVYAREGVNVYTLSRV